MVMKCSRAWDPQVFYSKRMFRVGGGVLEGRVGWTCVDFFSNRRMGEQTVSESNAEAGETAEH